jgi:Putative Flp pilus-assembly TadE/G-like
MGVIGLSLEVGRYYLLHSQLQDMADAAALAGAKQLDGLDTARQRARDAAEAVVNPQWWSNTLLSPTRIDDSRTFFYSRLNPDVEATSDIDAFYIKVTTNFGTIAPAFLRAVGATIANQTRATATAAYLPIVCKVQPLMMCNPLERADPPQLDFYAAFTGADVSVKKGVQFHMKVKGDATPGGDGNSWAPGDFGLLDPPGLNSSGANLTRNLLSQQSPDFCFANNLSPRTGEAVQKVSDGINVRFDMPVNGNQTGLDTTTAPNIIRGLYQNQCTGNPKYNCTTTFTGPGSSCSPTLPDRATVPMPEDANTTIVGNMIKGDGTGLNFADDALATKTPYSPNDYWNRHYGSNWPSEFRAVGQPNRYLAYLREMTLTPLTLDGSGNIIPSGQPPSRQWLPPGGGCGTKRSCMYSSVYRSGMSGTTNYQRGHRQL